MGLSSELFKGRLGKTFGSHVVILEYDEWLLYVLIHKKACVHGQQQNQFMNENQINEEPNVAAIMKLRNFMNLK